MKREIKIVIGLAVVLLFCYFSLSSLANDETYTGEFIRANKVYMPDNNIKLVIYFNESDSIQPIIFDDWDAYHSVQMSNMVEGSLVKVHYKEYVVDKHREIVRIELL